MSGKGKATENVSITDLIFRGGNRYEGPILADEAAKPEFRNEEEQLQWEEEQYMLDREW